VSAVSAIQRGRAATNTRATIAAHSAIGRNAMMRMRNPRPCGSETASQGRAMSSASAMTTQAAIRSPRLGTVGAPGVGSRAMSSRLAASDSSLTTTAPRPRSSVSAAMAASTAPIAASEPMGSTTFFVASAGRAQFAGAHSECDSAASPGDRNRSGNARPSTSAMIASATMPPIA
jgi:hypothetical protein